MTTTLMLLLIYLLTHKKYPDGRETVYGIKDSEYYVETTYPDGSTERKTITQEEFDFILYQTKKKEVEEELVEK